MMKNSKKSTFQRHKIGKTVFNKFHIPTDIVANKETIYLNKKLNEGKKICKTLILILNFKKKDTNKKINIAKK